MISEKDKLELLIEELLAHGILKINAEPELHELLMAKLIGNDPVSNPKLAELLSLKTNISYEYWIGTLPE